jgi:hypothetical protein
MRGLLHAAVFQYRLAVIMTVIGTLLHVITLFESQETDRDKHFSYSNVTDKTHHMPTSIRYCGSDRITPLKSAVTLWILLCS